MCVTGRNLEGVPPLSVKIVLKTGMPWNMQEVAVFNMKLIRAARGIDVNGDVFGIAYGSHGWRYLIKVTSEDNHRFVSKK